MSDGLKTGLILGGAGLVAFLLWERSQAQAAGLTTTTPTGTPNALSNAPGVGTSPPTAGAPATSGTASSTSSTSSRLTTVAKLAAAPVYYPTKAVISAASYVGSKLSSIF